MIFIQPYRFFISVVKVLSIQMSNVENNPSRQTGRSSDYQYGRTAELKVGRLVNDLIGGSSMHRSAGSRGPSDVTVYKNGTPTYDIQCKASRASSKLQNICSQDEKNALIKYSNEHGTIPLISQSKGKHTKITYAVSGKLFYEN